MTNLPIPYVAGNRSSLNTKKRYLRREQAMKKIMIILAILFLSPFSFAVDIQAPEKIPSYAPFTFRATLPGTDTFTSATILFDNILVATVYPTGTCSIQPDWVPFLIHCATYDVNPNTNEGLTTIITHTGFAKGVHTIAVQTQGSKSEYHVVSLHVIDALDAEVKISIDADVNALQNRVGTLETITTNTEQKVYETQADLNQTSELSNTSLNEIKTRLDKLEAPSPSMLTQPSNGGFNIPFLSNNENSTGFVSGSSMPLYGILVLLAGALVFLFVRTKSKGGNWGGKSSTPFFEGSLDTLFKGVPASPNTDGRQNPRPKKWSAEVSGEKELRDDIEQNPPEKINFGDLVKQERD